MYFTGFADEAGDSIETPNKSNFSTGMESYRITLN